MGDKRFCWWQCRAIVKVVKIEPVGIKIILCRRWRLHMGACRGYDD